jgi:hypothetical protein
LPAGPAAADCGVADASLWVWEDIALVYETSEQAESSKAFQAVLG